MLIHACLPGDCCEHLQRVPFKDIFSCWGGSNLQLWLLENVFVLAHVPFLPPFFEVLRSDQSISVCYGGKKKQPTILSLVQAIVEHTGVFSHALRGEVYDIHTGQESGNLVKKLKWHQGV